MENIFLHPKSHKFLVRIRIYIRIRIRIRTKMSRIRTLDVSIRYGDSSVLHAELILTTWKGFLQCLKIAVNVISQTGGDAKQYQR
jgi:hypothetical protein